MTQYLELLQHIIDNGVLKEDRTGTGTLSTFGYQMRFNLEKRFPLVTTKKLGMKAIVSELLWFLEGSTDERRLAEIYYGKDRKDLVGKSTIWTANADNQGKSLGYENTDTVKNLGNVYGAQWRQWVSSKNKFIDQISQVIHSIKTSPDSRRHIVSAWNVGELESMALPPCHTMFQFYVANNKLSLQLYQRSGDAFLGIPFNIASYSLLLMMVAQVTGYTPYEFIHTIGDAHIYSNHIDQVKEQLTRESKLGPQVILNPEITNIFDFKMTDITLRNYDSWPAIKAPMAI